MANNELSGPVVLNGLLDYIKKDIKKENILIDLSFNQKPLDLLHIYRYSKKLEKNVICGFNLSCVGDERCYSYVNTPYKDTIADQALYAATFKLNNVKVYSFLERGSDERQYCSPLLRLPLCTFSRSKFGEYPEYHSDADNLNLVSENGLEGSLNVLKNIVDAFETSLYPKITTYCEPQMGKRNLYPKIGASSKGINIKKRMDLLAYCDGKENIFEICKIIDCDLESAVKELIELKEIKLLE